MKIYTKTGDKGTTGLFGGGRVPKDDIRVEAYGDVDELNAVSGVARSVETMPRIDEVLVPIQRDLFAIGALLATPDRDKMALHLQKARIDEARISELERAIDEGEAELEPLTAFIIPGGSPKAAALHVARTGCRRAGRHGRATVHRMRAGEAHKTRDTWSRLTDDLLAAGCGRDTTVVALGGGVVGDLAGFVAATYMRGVPVVQCPTSLLAMIDASVGGKTGGDTVAGKNLVGAFHPPAAGLIDVETLRTLPMAHRPAGLAPAIKHGVVADAAYFPRVETLLPAPLHGDASPLL